MKASSLTIQEYLYQELLRFHVLLQKMKVDLKMKTNSQRVLYELFRVKKHSTSTFIHSVQQTIISVFQSLNIVLRFTCI